MIYFILFLCIFGVVAASLPHASHYDKCEMEIEKKWESFNREINGKKGDT